MRTALRAGLLAMAVMLIGGCSFLGIGAGAAPAAGQVSVFHLKAGYCFDPPYPIEAQIATVIRIPCNRAHTEESYAQVRDGAGSSYPGSDSLERFANAECLQRFAPYVGTYYQHSQLYFTYLLPSVRSWAAGDHSVVCVITTNGQPLYKSVKGSRL